MLEDLQAAEGDLAAALPTVGEEDTEHGRFRPGVLSQFSLLEESGPSMPPTQLSGPMEQHVQTLEVLTSLRSLTPSHELSLTQATLGLSRMEAAQVFSHILGKKIYNLKLKCGNFLICFLFSCIHLQWAAPRGSLVLTRRDLMVILPLHSLLK